MSPNPGRLEALDAQIDEYQVDGVVEVLLQACHTFAIESDAIPHLCHQRKRTSVYCNQYRLFFW